MAATGTDLSTSWAEWVAAQLEAMGWSRREFARRAGINDATVGRWVRGKNVPTEAEVIRRVAEVAGQNPVLALIAAGMITADEVNATITTELVQLQDVTDQELVEEVARRFEAYAQGAEGPTGSAEDPRPARRLYATNESIAHLQPGEQLAARRDERGNG